MIDMEITARPEPRIPGTDRIDVQRAGRGCDKPGELRRRHFRRYNDLERFVGLVHGLAMRLWILPGSQPSRLDAMVRRVQAAAFGVLIGVFLCGRTGHAQDFTWSATPASGLWSNAANWSPNTGPPSVADTAIFGGSTVTSITLGGAGVNTMQFNAGAPAYSFTLTGPATFPIFGSIVNNSSNQPTFTLSATSPNVANLIFENAAANAIIINNAGGNTEFVASSTAANATITNNNGGTLQFLNTAAAGSATITTNSGGLTEFENQATGGSARLITNAGGTVDLSLLASGFTGMTAGSIEGAGTYALGGFTFTVGSNNLSTTVSGTIQGPGALVKVGTGTLTLTGTNTQAVTGFDGGVVAVNTDANLGTGILDFNGGTLEALAAGGGIASSKLVAVNAGGATFLADPGTTSTLSGAMDGSGALTLTGSGTLILTGANSYGGGTTISGGTLQLGNGVKTGIIFGDVVNDAALVFDESSDVTFSGAISGTGTLTQNGSTTLILTGNNTFTGTTFVNAGTLQIGNGGTTGSIVGNVTDDTAVVFDRSDTLTIGGVISGTGSLTQAGTGTLVLTGANTYTGGTTISAGTLELGPGGSIVGNVTDNGALVFNRPDNVFYSGAITGAGTLTQSGHGNLVLGGVNTYSGATNVASGALDANSSTGFSPNSDFTVTSTLNLGGFSNTVGSLAGTGTVTNNGFFGVSVLTAGGDNASTTFSGVLTDGLSTFGFIKTGTGTMVLTGRNTYTGGTTISAGTLQIGNGGTGGSIVGNVTDNAALVFDRSDSVTFSGTVSGTGTLTQNGTGTLDLTGANAYSGNTNVNAGTLRVDGSLGTGAVSVASGATLGGAGTIGGPVTIQNGGTLAPGDAPGTLTTGTLTLSSGSILDYQLGTPNVVGGGVNDLVIINGNLTLAGTLNVSNAGGFGSGLYRLFNYTGSLTNNGLTLNSVPAGFTPADFLVQTTQAGQVNLLVSASGFANQYWDGTNTVADGTIHGGSGTWDNVTTNWTNANGTVNAFWNQGLAIFEGTAGTVSLGANIQFSGMQFLTGGYVIRAPGAQTLIAAPATTIDVGPGLIATISAPIVDGASPAAITLTDSGTLILTGANTYTGGTTINAGTLQIGNGGASGSIVGNVTDNGALVVDLSSPASLTLAGVISGSGSLAQSGSGTLILTGTNSYSGGTTISAGTLQIGSGGASGSIVGNVTDNGALVFDRSDSVTFAGTISGAGSLTQNGSWLIDSDRRQHLQRRD